jgi:hypothetical protein
VAGARIFWSAAALPPLLQLNLHATSSALQFPKNIVIPIEARDLLFSFAFPRSHFHSSPRGILERVRIDHVTHYIRVFYRQ